jgi:hypothetical protein
VTTALALEIVAIGILVGFVSGLFGKGGSAIATPLLNLAGVAPIVAVASPLPATIPSTIVAANAYRRGGYLDRRLVALTIVIGAPATIAGAIATHWIDGHVLVLLTDLLIAALGVRVLVGVSSGTEPRDDGSYSRRTASLIALGVGFSAGLLANSGGALLAPLYLTMLRLPIKRTFATSLTAATVLAIPATIIHASLGHIDWAVVAVFGAASIPSAAIGARFAVRMHPSHLERQFGIVLTLLGVTFAAACLT